MKKLSIVLALAVALTAVFAATALADHSPTFFVEWSEDASFTGYVEDFGNYGTGSPHQNYLEGTEKCAVCHSVHRAPTTGVKWDTNPADDASKTAVAGGQYNRGEFESMSAATGSGKTEMLLMSDVANSCNYCHVSTSIGGEQLYAGSVNYINSEDALGADEWDEGFGHHNGCTGCHAVHGASSNYGNPALYGDYGTFQGPLKSKVLKVRAKGAGGAGDRAYVWQDETVKIGSAGITELQGSGISGMAAWASAQTADDTRVDPKNVPLFPSETDAINGTNVRPGTDAYGAQASVFCTFCHQNYGYASEALVNPDRDRSLFQGPWYTLGENVGGTPGTWYSMNNATPGDLTGFKNHPVKSIDGTFTATGKSASVPAQVAWVGAETCVKCHDAGDTRDQLGVLVQSYPHFTPGYFHFVKSAGHEGGTMTNGPVEAGLIPDVVAAGDTAGLAAVQAWLDDPMNYEEAVTVADGQCLKCHVNNADAAGVGKTY